MVKDPKNQSQTAVSSTKSIATPIQTQTTSRNTRIHPQKENKKKRKTLAQATVGNKQQPKWIIKKKQKSLNELNKTKNKYREKERGMNQETWKLIESWDMIKRKESVKNLSTPVATTAPSPFLSLSLSFSRRSEKGWKYDPPNSTLKETWRKKGEKKFQGKASCRVHVSKIPWTAPISSPPLGLTPANTLWTRGGHLIHVITSMCARRQSPYYVPTLRQLLLVVWLVVGPTIYYLFFQRINKPVDI